MISSCDVVSPDLAGCAGRSASTVLPHARAYHERAGRPCPATRTGCPERAWPIRGTTVPANASDTGRMVMINRGDHMKASRGPLRRFSQSAITRSPCWSFRYSSFRKVDQKRGCGGTRARESEGTLHALPPIVSQTWAGAPVPSRPSSASSAALGPSAGRLASRGTRSPSMIARRSLPALRQWSLTRLAAILYR